MLDTLWTVAMFLIAVTLLIAVHEWGHFIVARLLGVKVLRYSIGFGRHIFSMRSKNDIEYVVGILPIGGYVKMLDEREGPVPASELHLAFNRKSLWRRTLIVLAGPVLNFIFAFFAYWMTLLIGYNTTAPIVGEVVPQSPAAVAGVQIGDEIVKINGHNTSSWRSVSMALFSRIGSKGTLVISVNPKNKDDIIQKDVSLAKWEIDKEQPDPLKSFGIIPFRPTIPSIVDKVLENSPAAIAGVKPGDKIIEVEGQDVEDWADFGDSIKASAGKKVNVTLLRDQKRVSVHIIPRMETVNGVRQGRIGIQSAPIQWPDDMIREERFGPVEAILPAVSKTWQMCKLSVKLMVSMIVGDVSVKSISGPIGIAQMAGVSAKHGLTYFLSFLALVSVSLGILNLLPIPVLDGGHLFYFACEAIRGKPLSEQVQVWGIQAGLAILLILMAFAFYNDIIRLL